MYTLYRNYKQLIKDVKHRKVVPLHASIMHIAEKVATCKHITIGTENFGEATVTVMRYNKPITPIGTAIFSNGVSYPIVGIDYMPSSKEKVLKILMNGFPVYRKPSQVKSYSMPKIYHIAFHPVAQVKAA